MNSPAQNPEQNTMNQLTDVQEYLNRLPIFSGAPGGVVKLFAYLAKKEEYAKGQHIIREGERCNRFFLLVSGKIELYQYYDERRFHLQMLSDTNFNYFGELALLADFSWFFSAKAWTDVVLLSISREAFSKVLERYPESYQSMVQKIVTLRINRFADQQQYLMNHLEPGAWREYPPEE